MSSTQDDLLVELLVEELPPKSLATLGQAFARTLRERLAAQGLCAQDAPLDVFATPRRLAALIGSVQSQAAHQSASLKLMPVSVGLDATGAPTPALLKKLQGLGLLSTDDATARASNVLQTLERRSDGKSEVLYVPHTRQGVHLQAGLQIALEATLAGLPIPKVMSYQLHSGCEMPGWSTVSFVRPAHGLLALHGKDVVDVSALGLRAGRTTQGHRFEARTPTLEITQAKAYVSELAEQGRVIASFETRRDAIAQQLQAAARHAGPELEPIDDPALLDEVTALVEHPHVLICQFDRAFLSIPQACLILTMKANQKYFPLLDAKGQLTHQFLVVSNISPSDQSAVVQGNERVVRPRLADAKFFFDQDRKHTLESRIEGLFNVVYQRQLGSQGERMTRVVAIATLIVEQLRRHTLPYTVQAKDAFDMLLHKVREAARLAKADLLTDMVGEFPELQGIMGGHYARAEGLRDGAAIAIEDHYKPRFAGDALPRNHTGTIVALADKLETLVGLFGIGSAPSGDKDPFALRRHALGVIRILIEKNLPLSLPALLDGAYGVFGEKLPAPDAAAAQQAGAALRTFFHDRLTINLKEQGYTAQEVDAVLALAPERLGDVPKRLAAVRAFGALPQAPSLAAANKRVSNILKKASGAFVVTEAPVVDPHRLREPAEQQLYAALQTVRALSDAAFEAGDYTQSLSALAALKTPVDDFFESVMVNTDDPALQQNRLALLRALHQAMNRIADLSRMVATTSA